MFRFTTIFHPTMAPQEDPKDAPAPTPKAAAKPKKSREPPLGILNADPTDPEVCQKAELYAETHPMAGLHGRRKTKNGAEYAVYRPIDLKRLLEWDRRCTGKPPSLAVPEQALCFSTQNDAELVGFQLRTAEVYGQVAWPRGESVILARDAEYWCKEDNCKKTTKKFVLFPDRNAALRHLVRIANTPAANYYDIIGSKEPVQFFADIDLEGEKLKAVLDSGLFKTPLDFILFFARELDTFLASKGIAPSFEHWAVSESSARDAEDWIKWSLHCAVDILKFHEANQLFKFVDELCDHFDAKADCRAGGTSSCSSGCAHLKYKFFTRFFGIWDVKVYTKNREMRCLFNTKMGKERYLRPLMGFNARTDALASAPVHEAIAAFLGNIPKDADAVYLDSEITAEWLADWRKVKSTHKVQISDVESLILDMQPGVRVFANKEFAVEYCKERIAAGFIFCQIVAHERKRNEWKTSDKKYMRYLVLDSYECYKPMCEALPNDEARRFHSQFSSQR